MPARRSPEWFERWFDDTYAELYSHRNADQARRQVEALLRLVPGVGRGPVLDLACGSGRHLKAFRSRGIQATGADLSLPLLRQARSVRGAVLARADMRHLPFKSGSFRGVASFFSSFGYFRRPADDLSVLREMKRILAPSGWLFLDLANPEYVKAHLVPRDEKKLGRRNIVQSRSLRGGVVRKTIEIREGKSRKTYTECLRLYDLPRAQALCRQVGLTVRGVYGDEECSAFDVATSPRLALMLDTSKPKPKPKSRGQGNR